MKIKEWVILGFLFMLLNNFLIFQDVSFEQACNYKHKQLLEPIETIGDLECVINAEILDPFIWTTAGIWFICWIMALVTWFERKRGER